jgi:3-hydroxymyristoyl/3-hydroxydecanoyl-(acyl carrier protein) dehydratase
MQTASKKPLRGQMIIPADLPYFDGHFPGRSILPAVATIELAINWLSKTLAKRPLKLVEVRTAKFNAPIFPGHNIELSATQVGQDEWQVAIADANSKLQMADLRLLFRTQVKS